MALFRCSGNTGGGGMKSVDEIAYVASDIGYTGSYGYCNFSPTYTASNYPNMVQGGPNLPTTTIDLTDCSYGYVSSALSIQVTAKKNVEVVVRYQKNSEVKEYKETLLNGSSKTYNLSDEYSTQNHDRALLTVYVTAQ